MSDTVQVVRHNGIIELQLNRPNAFNAIDMEMAECFGGHLRKLAVDDSVQGIMISGNGKAFCAGGDLRWTLNYPGTPKEALYQIVHETREKLEK